MLLRRWMGEAVSGGVSGEVENRTGLGPSSSNGSSPVVIRSHGASMSEARKESKESGVLRSRVRLLSRDALSVSLTQSKADRGICDPTAAIRPGRGFLDFPMSFFPQNSATMQRFRCGRYIVHIKSPEKSDLLFGNPFCLPWPLDRRDACLHDMDEWLAGWL